MPFTATKWFPFSVGFAVLVVAIGVGAVGLVSPKISGSVAMFGMGFVLDGSAGVHALPLLAIKSAPQRAALAERIMYSKAWATPRYMLALGLGLVFLLMSLLTISDIALIAALVGCVTIYGVVAFVSLLRAFAEAGASPAEVR